MKSQERFEATLRDGGLNAAKVDGVYTNGTVQALWELIKVRDSVLEDILKWEGLAGDGEYQLYWRLRIAAVLGLLEGETT